MNITSVPEYHVYRRSGDKILDDLLIDTKNFAKPQFARLKRKSQYLECRHFCVVYIGTPTNYQINKYISIIDESLAYISCNSTFAKMLKLKNTQWILFEGLKRRYSIIQNRENIPKEIEKYRNNALLMKKLPSDVNIDLNFLDWIDDAIEYCDKALRKLMNFLFLRIFAQFSTELVMTGFLIFFVCLFCCCN